MDSQEGTKTLPPGQFLARRWAIYAALGIPYVDPEAWRLKVTGLVEKDLAFSHQELLNLPSVKLVRDFSCVTGWTVTDVVWEGVSFRTLAEMAGVISGAKFVMFRCVDGYTAPVRVEDALAEDSIIALRMNGKPLSKEQGFPARPFIPRLYGWKSAKWLTEIEFIPSYVDGYWEVYGYHERGDVWEEERFKGHQGKHSPRRSLGTRPF